MRYKRISAALTAACLLLCGCSTAETESSAPPEESIAETLSLADDPLTTQVRVEELELDITDGGFASIFPTADGYGTFLYPDRERGMHYVQFSKDMTATADTPLTPPATQEDFYYTSGLYTYADGTIYSLAVMEWHSGMAPYDNSGNGKEFDWEAYEKAVKFRYLLCTYTTDGTLASAVPVDGLHDYREDRLNLFSQFTLENEELYLTLTNGCILHINKENGDVTEVYRMENVTDSMDMNLTLCRDRDGTLLLHTARNILNQSTMMWDYETNICEFDLQSGTCGAELYRVEGDSTDYAGFVPGYGDYRFCVRTKDHLLGIKEDGTEEQLIEWKLSDLPSPEIFPLGDNQFFSHHWGDSGPECYRLTRMRQSETHEPQVLTLIGLGGGGNLAELVRNFNRTQEDFRIDLLHDPLEGMDEETYEEYKMQILTDDSPDIVIVSNHEEARNLGKRGVFADLLPLMENDTEMNRSAFVPNVLTALETPDGALYTLPLSFSVQTLAVKSKFHNTENWTISDMIALYDSAEKDVYQWETRGQMLWMLLRGMDFVDEENGTCSFDSPEFVQLLEFCKRFPEKPDRPEKNEESKEQMLAIEEYYRNAHFSHQRDENLLYPLTFSTGSVGGGYAYAKAKMGEDITLAGYPSTDGQGGRLTTESCIAISSRCENTAVAWEFVKYYLQNANMYTSGMSILEERFEEELDNWTKTGSLLGYVEEDELKLYPIKKKQRDTLEEYIRSVTALSPQEQESLMNIIEEEAEMFLAGDQSAEDAARKVQSRAEIMVSEQS